MSKKHQKDFGRLFIFYHAAKTASFSRAARSLGLSRTMITQSVEALEESLSVRLFNRTTRSFSMTKQGELLFERAERMVQEFECMLAECEADAQEVRGRIALQLPAVLDIPAVHATLARYLQQHPKVTFDIASGNEVSTMAARNIDIALHLGALQNSSLHAKQVHTFGTCLVGSARYFEQAGPLRHPSELQQHQVFRYAHLMPGDKLMLRDPQTKQQQAFPLGRVSNVNSERSALAFAQSGHGLANALDISCAEFVKQGLLLPMLPEWTVPVPLSLVYLTKKAMPRSLRLLIDTLALELPAALAVPAAARAVGSPPPCPVRT